MTENEASHTAVLAPKASAPAYNLYTEGKAVFVGSKSSHSSGTELILFPSISPKMNFRATSHSLRNPVTGQARDRRDKSECDTVTQPSAPASMEHGVRDVNETRNKGQWRGKGRREQMFLPP